LNPTEKPFSCGIAGKNCLFSAVPLVFFCAARYNMPSVPFIYEKFTFQMLSSEAVCNASENGFSA